MLAAGLLPSQHGAQSMVTTTLAAVGPCTRCQLQHGVRGGLTQAPRGLPTAAQEEADLCVMPTLTGESGVDQDTTELLLEPSHVSL